MGIPIAKRRPHVTGQRPAHAPAGTKASGAAPHPIPRSPSHLRDDGAPERRGCENGVLDAGSLLGGVHAGYLRPRYHRRAAQGGANGGEHPIPCRLMLSATRSRWGQRLGQKKAVSENGNL